MLRCLTKGRAFRAVVAVFVILGLVLPMPRTDMLLEPERAEARYWNHSLVPNEWYTFSNHSPNRLQYVERWTVYVNGRSSGQCGYFKDTRADGYNFIEHPNTLGTTTFDSFIREINGDPSYVRSTALTRYITIGGVQRPVYHIRDVAWAAGATLSWTQGRIDLYPTSSPTARVSAPATVAEGTRVDIRLSATSHVPSMSGSKSIRYSFWIGNNRVINNETSPSNLSRTYAHTFSQPGTYELRLEVHDSIGRSGQATATVTVRGQAAPPPPQPPSGGGEPTAYFTMPSSAEVGDLVRVTCLSEPSPGASIVSRTWSVSPSDYSGTLSGTSSSIRFNSPGTYSVTLTIRDSANKTDSYTRHITVSQSPPPPPTPELTARIGMPSEAGINQPVNIRNLSTVQHATIDSAEWRVTPSSGWSGTLNDDGGVLTFSVPGTYTVRLTVRAGSLSDTATETIEIVNRPPVARISLPDRIVQGEDVEIRCTSYDPDGDIVKRTWQIEPTDGVVGDVGGQSFTVYFDQARTYTVTLTVEDEHGAKGTTSKTVEIEPAVPTAYFTAHGAFKQYRLLTFKEEGQSSPRYPIVQNLNEWKYERGGGGAVPVVIGSHSTKAEQHVLFEQPGTYRVGLRVTNSAGNKSDWYYVEFEIQPDLPPVADFIVQSATIREAGENRARINLGCTSYSPDGDQIVQRIWRYRFDSNNDGSFADEQWVTFSTGNDPTPVLEVHHVGRYQFELEVVEGFGQPTLPGYALNPPLKANTAGKPLAEKVTEVINIRPTVSFQLHEKKKVDVVFTVGDVATHKVQNLEGLIAQHLETELNARNIDYRIQAIDTATISTEAAGAEEIFNGWVVFPSNYGEWRVDPANNILYTPDYVNPPFETGFYDPNSFSTKDFSIQAMIKANDPYQPMGFILKLSPKGNGRYRLYFLWLSSDSLHRTKTCLTLFKADDFYFNYKHSATPLAIYPDSGTYKYGWPNHQPYDYGGFPHGTPMQKGLTVSNKWDPTIKTTIMDYYMMPYISNTAWYNLKVEVSGNLISVYWDNTEVMTVYDADMIPTGAYGFFQYSHVVPNFKDITIETKHIKTLDEVLRQPEWRDDALRFVVNISDERYPEFDDAVKSAYIYYRLLSDELDFLVMGSSANQAQTQQIVARNDGRGLWVNNSNMNQAMQQVTQYIINKVNQRFGPVDKYVLLNQEVEYETHYSDHENDPIYATRWRYDHDHLYFDNSLGQALCSGVWVPDKVTSFDKVGKFTTVFQARDNPVGNDDRFDEYRLWSYMPQDYLDIYVHRRPVAVFSASMSKIPNSNNYSVQITGHPYDLDHYYSCPQKGIIQEKWEWRVATGTTWNSGKPSTLTGGNEYLVRYTVRDKEGAWSVPAVTLLSTRGIALPPEARFTVTPRVALEGEYLTLKCESFDPSGGIIAQREWRYARDGGSPQVFTPTHVGGTEFRWTPPGPGEYTIHLRVRSSNNLWSETFAQQARVVTRPVASFTVTPNPVYEYQAVTYTDQSYDPGGARLVQRQWRIRKDGGSWMYYGDINSLPRVFETAGGPGTYRIELRVQNEYGIWSHEDNEAWFARTLTVREGYQVTGGIVPQPAERGREIRIAAQTWRLTGGGNQSFDFDTVDVHIVMPTKPNGQPALPDGKATEVYRMRRVGTGEYEYVYRLPEKTQPNRWPDDGVYHIRIVARRGDSVERSAILECEVKGHVLDRQIIRTRSW